MDAYGLPKQPKCPEKLAYASFIPAVSHYLDEFGTAKHPKSPNT